MQHMREVSRRAFLRGMVGVAAAVGLGVGSAVRPAFSAASSEGVEVLMVTDAENYFEPVGLWVPPGTTVRWVIQTGAHSATAYHPNYYGKPARIPEGAEPWDSGILGVPGDGFAYRFDTQGVYDYYCLPHEALGMVGRIVVGEPGNGPGTTPPDGLFPAARAVLERLPPSRIVQEKIIRWKDR